MASLSNGKESDENILSGNLNLLDMINYDELVGVIFDISLFSWINPFMTVLGMQFIGKYLMTSKLMDRETLKNRIFHDIMQKGGQVTVAKPNCLYMRNYDIYIRRVDRRLIY